MDGDGTSDLVRATACGLNRERHLVGTGLRVCVGGILPRSGLVVAEVPLVAVDALSRGGAGELCGLAHAHCGGIEIRCRQSVNGNGIGGGNFAVDASRNDDGIGGGLAGRHGNRGCGGTRIPLIGRCSSTCLRNGLQCGGLTRANAFRV